MDSCGRTVEPQFPLQKPHRRGSCCATASGIRNEAQSASEGEAENAAGRVLLAGLRDGLDPGEDDFHGFPVEIEEFNAHARLCLGYPDHSESRKSLALVLEGKTYTRADLQRAPSTDKATTEGEVRCYAFQACTGFQVQNVRVCRERIANGVAAVTETGGGGSVAAL